MTKKKNKNRDKSHNSAAAPAAPESASGSKSESVPVPLPAENAEPVPASAAAAGDESSCSSSAAGKEDAPVLVVKKTGRRILAVISIVLFLLLILSVSVTGLLLFLPEMVETKVNQVLTEMSRSGNVALQVRNIGLFQTNIACKIYDDDSKDKINQSVAAINSLTVTYSPIELLRGRIKQVNIENADLLTEYRDGVFSIPALDVIMQTFIKQKSETDNTKTVIPDDLNQVIPVSAEQINISGNLVLNVENDIVFVHYQASMKPDNSAENLQWNHITYQLDIVNQSNRLHFAGDYLHARRKVQLNAQAALFSQTIPAAFRQMMVRGLNVNADIDFRGTYFWDKKELQDTSLDGKFSLFYMPNKNIRIRCNPVLNLTYQQNQFRGILSGVTADVNGIPIALQSISANQKAGPKEKISGSIAVQAGKEKKVDLAWNYLWSVNDFKNWELVLTPTEASGKKAQQFIWNGFDIRANSALITPELICKNGVITLQTAAALKQISSTVPGSTEINIPDLKFNVQGNLNEKLHLDLVQQSPSADIRQSLQKFQQQQLKIQAAYQIPEARTSATLSMAAGNFRMPEQDIEVKDMQQTLPLIWPSPAADAPGGTIDLKQICYRGNPLANINAQLKFEDQKFFLESRGRILNQSFEQKSQTAPFAPGGLISENQFTIPKQAIAGLDALLPIFPAAEPWQCEGDLEFHAVYNIYPQKSGGNAEVRWTGGKVKNQDLDLNVEGIDFHFALPNLPVLASSANQTFAFEKASFQQVITENGELKFRMESPDVWYIENLNLKWCDGKLSLASTKIAPKEEKLSAVLHCDRIQLTRFLSQVGVGDLKGNGTISGMLPIYLQQNKILFQDGFLYSTPGEQGRIQGNISEHLWHNANQATGGAVSTELELAKDALKDFTYSWAKIYLESEENQDSLRLKLQFDGKPEQLLYYEFNDRKQGFQKAKIPYRFQGIQLDVNITLPVNNTLRLINSLTSKLDSSKRK